MTSTPVRLVWACLISLLFAVYIAAEQAPASDLRQLAGTYSFRAQFGGASITLEGDGTFRNDSASCTFTTLESGTYVVVGGTVRLTVLQYVGKQNGDGKELDLTNPKSRREFFGYSKDVSDEPLRTTFTLVPITWGERTYLIYEDDLASFSNAINLGLEPRERGPLFNYYGIFFLRDGDDEKPAHGKPSLPSKWQDLLLSDPINATIVSFEARKKSEGIATIDRGRADGVKVGMKFIARDQEPASWSDDGVVISVEEHSAKVKGYGRVVGENLSTKYLRKSFYQ